MPYENESAARRWFEEVWNTRRDETIEELMLPQTVGHMEGADVRGPSNFRAIRKELLTAFPDLKVVVEDTVSEGDRVVVRWSASGTHRGKALGFEATNLSVKFRGMTWLVIRDGRIVEGWDAWNQGKLIGEIQAAAARQTESTAADAARYDKKSYR